MLILVEIEFFWLKNDRIIPKGAITTVLSLYNIRNILKVRNTPVFEEFPTIISWYLLHVKSSSKHRKFSEFPFLKSRVLNAH